MRPLSVVKDTAGAVACEQAHVTVWGKKIARRGKESGKEAFSLFPLPSYPLN